MILAPGFIPGMSYNQNPLDFIPTSLEILLG